MLVHPVLQDGQAAHPSAVESRVRARGGDPDQVVDIAGRCAPRESGDLLRHVLFQGHHGDAGGQRVGVVNGELDPATLVWRQPRRGSDVQLCGQVADVSEGGLVVNAGTATMILDPVAESFDVLPVDLGSQKFGDGSGVVGGFADGEVEVGGKRPALPAYSLRSAVPPLKTRCSKMPYSSRCASSRSSAMSISAA